MINGNSGETHYITYDLEEFQWEKNRLEIKIGQSFFSEKRISLDINHPDVKIKGLLEYSGNIRYPKKWLAPGIMGWYSFVPFMECYHGVVSVNHFIEGKLNVNRKWIDFDGGKGYIEKDWGTSFPESWIWLQSNSFPEDDMSLFFSVAKIPWLGKFFMGFISFVYCRGEFYLFSTYNKSSLNKIKKDQEQLDVTLENKTHLLNIRVLIHQSGELIAPVKGSMKRRIKESINSSVSFSLIENQSGTIFEGHSERAGLEIMEDIFDYFKEG